MATVLSEGTISAGVSYSLKEFKLRTGLGTAALRECRLRGLTVRRVGLRSFVLGQDWLDYLASSSRSFPNPTKKPTAQFAGQRRARGPHAMNSTTFRPPKTAHNGNIIDGGARR